MRKRGIIIALVCIASLTMISCKKEGKEPKAVSTKIYKILNDEIERGSSIFNEIVIVKKKDKYGIQSIDGEIIEEMNYDKILRIADNSYYLEKEEFGIIKNITNNRSIEVDEIGKISEDYLKILYKGKFGIVDKNLNWILPLEYDYLDYNDKYVIAAREEKLEVYNIEMKKLKLGDNGKVILGIGDYLYSIKNEKLGIVDKNGDTLIKSKYDNFLKLNNSNILIGYLGENKYLINLKKKTEQLVDYENFGEESEGLILTLKDKKLGYIDDTGKEIIPNKYDVAFKVQKESKYLQVKEGNKWLLIEKNGKLYKELPYDDLGEYKDGYTLVMLDNKLGYIDRDGNEKIAPQFLYATSFNKGYAIVGTESGLGTIDSENKVIIPMIYDDIDIKNEYVYVKMDNKKGILDLSGQEILPVIYDELGEINDNILFYKKGSESGYIEIEKEK